MVRDYNAAMQPVPRAIYLFVFAVFLVCSLMLSCGGGSSKPKPLTITISPSSAALGVNDSVAMSVETSPELPKYAGHVTWSIDEYQSSTRCTEEVLDSNVSHPIADCPFGWLEITTPITGYPARIAYYYSPEAAGVWHVTTDANITNGTGTTEYQGSTSATVTVTNP